MLQIRPRRSWLSLFPLLSAVFLVCAFALSSHASADAPVAEPLGGGSFDPTATPTSTPLALPLCPGGFVQVASPNAPPNSGLLGLGFSGPLDGWSVGYTMTTATTSSEPGGAGTLIEHWNGVNWSIVPSPNQGPSRNHLWSVLPLSADNAWAVGAGNSIGYDASLILHWDGVEWSPSPHPNTSTTESYLRDLYAFSPDNIWTMGLYYDSVARALLLHWNGVDWSQVPVPSMAPANYYPVGFTAIDQDDMWIVGYSGSAYPNYVTRVLHWDGEAWTVAPSPNPGSIMNALGGVSGTASDDVWAVGGSSGSDEPLRGLALHWDGDTWESVPVPRVGTGENSFEDVLALGHNDAWAVGMFHTTPDDPFSGLVMHWDGISWSAVPMEHPGTESRMYDVTVEGDTLWVTGYYIENGQRKTLIEKLDMDCPQPTSTPTSTPTETLTPTFTPTNTPTNTPTFTPTPCTVEFEDVPPGSTFYPFVRCLACKGIVSGYPCGGEAEPCGPRKNPYFRLGLFVTRAQLSKILSQSAGFNESIPDGGQTFEDVPPGSSFYLYVERLANRDVMGGYQCGILFDEPCGRANRPYFRPLNNATRGQVSKMIANVSGFNAPVPSGEYTFADVTDEHPYHLYVERWLANRPGAISGYTCGGAGEPCDDRSRPYFRPNDLLTRGQLSKIAANTFFPDCKP